MNHDALAVRPGYAKARAIVGSAPRLMLDGQGQVRDWSWPEEEVRAALRVPADMLWFTRILDLERQSLARLCFHTATGTLPNTGQVYVRELWPHTPPEGWRDQALADWATVVVRPIGVLRLARLYGIPVPTLSAPSMPLSR